MRDYYDINARDYAIKTGGIDMSRHISIFTNSLKGQSREILDLGCGCGRDTETLSRMGYNIIPLDKSEKMIAETFKRTGFLGVVLDFTKRLPFKEKYFNGIWASASLVHLPKRSLIPTIENILEHLKKDGVMYISLKEGDGEFQQYDGRSFSHWKIDEVIKYINSSAIPVNIATAYESVSNHSKWVNVVLIKK